MFPLLYFVLVLDFTFPVLDALFGVERQLQEVTVSYLASVIRSTYLIRDIPEWLKHNLFYEQVIKSNFHALASLPKFIGSPELYLQIVTENSECVQYIPNSVLTPEFCMRLVKANTNVISFLKKTQRFSDDAILYALEKNYRLFSHIIEPTHAMRLVAVRNNPWFLMSIDKKHRTYDICKEAVKKDPGIYDHISKRHRTPELTKIAGRNW